jgi:ribonuclease Z
VPTFGVLDVIVLGSGTPNPDAGRAGAAVAVVDDSSWLLVDCGRGATQRALDTGLDPRTLAAVLLTHHHSDHISDLATLAIARWCAGATTPLTVVAPLGPAIAYADACLDAFPTEAFHRQARRECGPRPTIATTAFSPTIGGDHAVDVVADVVAEIAGWTIASASVDHHPIEPAVGYAVERGGRRVAISGDTAVGDGIRALARGATVLVHEALLEARVAPALLDWNASARSVGHLAATTNPATLVLTHLIPAPVTPDDIAAFVADVRAGGFTGHVEIAVDGLRVTVG